MARTAKQELSYQKSRIRKQISRMQKRGYVFEGGDPFPALKNKTAKGQAAELKRFTTENLYKKASYVKPTGEYVSGIEGRKYERKQSSLKSALTRANKAREDFHNEKGTKTSDRPADQKSEIFENLSDELSFDSDEEAQAYMQNLSDILFETYQTVVDFDPNEQWVSWYRGMIDLKERQRETILSIFDAAISDEGKFRVAKNIEENASTIRELLDRMLYSSYSGEHGMAQARQDRVTLTNILTGKALTAEQARKIARGTV